MTPSDMPQDDTWQPYRHHSNIFPLFRNHLTRNAVAMFLPPLNPVASTEHECRDAHLPVVPHTEDAEEKGRRVVLGVPELSNVHSTTTPPGPQYLKMLPLKQQTQAVNDRIPAKGCRHLLVKPRQRDMRVSCVESSSTTRAGSLEPASQLVTSERKLHSNRTVEGRTELDLVQDEFDEAKRLLEEAHLEVQAAQSKVTEACRVGEARNCWRRNWKLEPADQ